MRNTEFGVVLLNWNNSHETIPCLQSLYTASPRPNHVIVVDNGSTDSSIANIQTWGNTQGLIPGWLIIFQSPSNKGFAGGNNLGINYLREKSACTHILLLNNDTEVAPDFFEKMANALRLHPDTALATGTIYYDHDRSKVWYAGGYEVPFRALTLHRTVVPESSNPIPTEFISGCTMVISRETLDKIGELPEIYFPLYFEDAEYCHKARKAGLQLLYVPEAVVYHKVGATVGAADASPNITYVQNKLRGFYVRRNYSGINKFVATLYLLCTKPVRSALHLLRGKPELARAVLAGTVAGLKGTWPRRSAFQNPINYTAAVTSEIVSPLLSGAAKLAVRRPPSSPDKWRRGLILSHNHIGDVLYRTASLKLLSESLPNCQWDYLTSPGSEPILKGNPYLDDVLPWQTGDSIWSISRSAFGKLAKRNYDIVLCTDTFRVYESFSLAVALRIPNRVGYDDKGFSGLLTHQVTMGDQKPFPKYFRSMVEQVTGKKSADEVRPQICLTTEDYEQAESVIKSMRFIKGIPIVACAPLSRASSGNWPPKLFLDNLRQLFRGQTCHIALCGSSSERSQLEDLAHQTDIPCSVVAGDLTLRGFAAFLQRCAALVTADSGPRHIGNAMGLRVYFMRNTVNPPAEAGPYCSTETDITP